MPEGGNGETREKIAKATGKGARTLEKAEAIVEAAEANPELGKLVEAMDRTGRVNGPYKRLQNIIAAEAIKKEPPSLPMNGPYRAGIIDPPWASEPDEHDKDHGGRGYYPYPTMTPEQIAALVVPSIMHADLSVWLWITNFHLLRGDHLTIAKAWDLKPVTLLTWIKRTWGQGQRARGATEHLIQMVRGKVLCLGADTKTWFDGEGGEHSQKPSEVYAIVEKLSPAPRYFELFSRGADRDNWDLHGNEIGKRAARSSATATEKRSPIVFLPVRDRGAGIRSLDDDQLEIPSFYGVVIRIVRSRTPRRENRPPQNRSIPRCGSRSRHRTVVVAGSSSGPGGIDAPKMVVTGSSSGPGGIDAPKMVVAGSSSGPRGIDAPKNERARGASAHFRRHSSQHRARPGETARRAAQSVAARPQVRSRTISCRDYHRDARWVRSYCLPAPK